jgi:sugar lactone lactonase YvrE
MVLYFLVFVVFDVTQCKRFNELLLILNMKKSVNSRRSCGTVRVVMGQWGCALAFFILHSTFAQTPLNTWRTHFSYQDTRGLVLATRQLYCFSSNGFFYINTTDNQAITLSKQNGLTENQIKGVAFSAATQQLIVGYESGNIDLIKTDSEGRPTDFSNLSIIKNTEQITGSKRINQIVVNGNDALIATDFGIVRLDVARSEIKETYRNLGANGQSVAIYNLAFANDSVFALTSGGLLAARFSASVNLQFYGNWKKVITPEPIQPLYVQAIDKQLFVAFSTKIYGYEQGRWTILKTYNNPITTLTVSNNRLLVGLQGQITTLNGDIWTNVDLNSPQAALTTADGSIWVATSQKGLLRNQNNQAQSLSPTSPQFGIYPKLFATTENIVALPVQNKGFDVFSAEKWHYFNLSVNAAAAAPLADGRIAIGTNEGILIKNSDNSFVKIPNSPANITDMATNRDGDIWVSAAPTDFNLPNLYVQKSGTVWQPFTISGSRLSALLIDDNNYKWLIGNNNDGIVVFDDKTNRTKQLTTAQNSGNLPSNVVNAFVKDRDGAVWVGTDRGVAVFDNFGVFGSTINAYTPIFERRKLLSNEYITCLAVDGANNKWVGTRNGLFQFGPDGTTLLDQFNELNSVLPSSIILSLAIAPLSGEVFISTNKGLVSYRGAANEPEASLSQISIFPNPIRPEFNGLVGITGLSENALVKITDLSGRLVFETRSQGGTASWNLFDYQGNRANSGVYLVLVTNASGQESLAGKLAVAK